MKWIARLFSCLVALHASANPAHWMQALAPAIGNRPLNEIYIPGAHDAGTYAISSESVGCPNDLSPLVAELTRWGTGPLALVSETQTLDVLGQLQLGVRFFDLRICKFQDDYWISHGQISYTVSNILDAIRSFTVSFPKEIVILEIGRFFNFGPEDHMAFQRLIDATFGSNIADEALSPHSLVADFWKAKKNVVIIYEAPSKYWSKARLSSPWAHSVDASYVLQFGEEHNDSSNANVLRVFQAIRTPTLESLTFENTSTILLSHPMNDALLSNLERIRNNHFNIVLYDDVGYLDLTEQLINLNGSLNAQSL